MSITKISIPTDTMANQQSAVNEIIDTYIADYADNITKTETKTTITIANEDIIEISFSGSKPSISIKIIDMTHTYNYRSISSFFDYAFITPYGVYLHFNLSDSYKLVHICFTKSEADDTIISYAVKSSSVYRWEVVNAHHQPSMTYIVNDNLPKNIQADENSLAPIATFLYESYTPHLFYLACYQNNIHTLGDIGYICKVTWNGKSYLCNGYMLLEA
jgi:hypothetical protein